MRPERSSKPLNASLRPIWMGMLAGLLAGCAAGPDFQRPAVPDAARYTASELPGRTVAAPTALGDAQRFVAGAPAEARWWQRFGSARLDALVDAALRASPTLEAMAARTEHRRHQFEAAHLSLIGNLVSTAIVQAQLAGQIEAGAAILAAQEEQLALTRRRLELGAAAERDVLAQQTQVEQTRAGLPPLRLRLEQNRPLLATTAL